MESQQELLKMEVILHKLFLIIVKYLPFIIALSYLIVSVLHCFGTVCYLIPNLFYMSPITALFTISASFAFKFCIWHRLPIYYVMILHLIAIIDYYTVIAITSFSLLFVYLVITILFILLGMILKNRYNHRRHKWNDFKM